MPGLRICIGSAPFALCAVLDGVFAPSSHFSTASTFPSKPTSKLFVSESWGAVLKGY